MIDLLCSVANIVLIENIMLIKYKHFFFRKIHIKTPDFKFGSKYPITSYYLYIV